MNKMYILIGFIAVIFSCMPPTTYVGCAPTIGDLIEYSVTIDSGSTIAPIVGYKNATEQIDYYYFPSNTVYSWSISFNTTKVNQGLYISFATMPSTGINKTAVIKVNGNIVDQGSGSSTVVIDCY